MDSPCESKSIVTLRKLDDDSFSSKLGKVTHYSTNAWSDKMLAILENTHTHLILRDLRYYINSLEFQLISLNGKAKCEQLSATILSHLQTINEKVYDENISLTISMIQVLEDILSLYGTVELKAVAILYKNKDSELQDNAAQLLKCSKQILSNLKNTFHWTNELNVVHCLLKIKYDRKSTASVAIIKSMYQHILYKNRISKLDDLALCGYYLLFCKYKKFIPSAEHNQMMKILLQRFNKKSSYLKNCSILRQILSPRDSVDGKDDGKGRVKTVSNYFEYVRSTTQMDASENDDVDNNKISSYNDNETNQEQNEKFTRYDNDSLSNHEECDDKQYDDDNVEEPECSKEERIVYRVDSTDDRKMIYFLEYVEDMTENTMLDTSNVVDDNQVNSNDVPDKNIEGGEENHVSNQPEQDNDDDDDTRQETTRTTSDLIPSENCPKVEMNEVDSELVKETTLDKSQEQSLLPISEKSVDLLPVHKTEIICPDEYEETENVNASERVEINLINQLHDYLSITKSETMPLITNNADDSLQSQQIQESFQVNPINYHQMHDQSVPRAEFKLDQVPENIYHHHQQSDPKNYSENISTFANVDETSNYTFEFGYETPPKDGNCEQEFSIMPTHMNIETDAISQNGLLTPENETVCHLIPPESYNPHLVQVECPVGMDEAILNSRQYRESPIFYAAPSFQSRVYCDTFAETSLDLSSKSRNDYCDQQDPVKSKTAITISGGVKVQKYNCNEEIISNLVMPSMQDISLMSNEATTKVLAPSTGTKSKKQLISSLDMDIDRAFAELSNKRHHTKTKKRQKQVLPSALSYNSIPRSDPKLFNMRPVVDLSSFRPSDFPPEVNTTTNCKITQAKSRSEPVPTTEMKTKSPKQMTAGILKDIHKKNYTDEELNLLLQAAKSSTETRLPFKKRRMAVPEEQTAEISYPATPMLSIAELAAIQPSNPLLPLPAHTDRAYLSEIPVEPEAVGVAVNFNVNEYPYNFVPRDASYFDVNSQHSVQYGHCMVNFDSKENLNMNLHYFRTES